MIIDTHTHLFPDAVKQNRSHYFNGEPEFKLLYDSDKSKIISLQQLLETMDEHKVDTSVICGFPWRNPETAILNNDVIIDAVKTYPDRIKGLACFDLAWKGAVDETRRCIKEGLSGAGELAFYLSGIDEKALSLIEPVMAVLRDNGNLPCMIHTNEPVGHQYPGKTPITLEQIYRLAQTFPNNKIILAHWGGGIFLYHLMKKNAKSILKNIWYDTAASPFLYEANIYDTALHAGVLDKVLLGTDYPLLTPKRYYTDLDNSNLSEDQKSMILGENASRLFK